MTLRTLIRRSLRFHWRAHLGVVLGAAVGSAGLLGALVVGDSVRGSLRQKAMFRLGMVEFALEGKERTFTEGLDSRPMSNEGEEMAARLGYNPLAKWPPLTKVALQVQGTASSSDGSSRANAISVFGVRQPPNTDDDKNRLTSDTLWRWPGLMEGPRLPEGEVWLNRNLADHLHLHINDTLLLRLPKRQTLAADAAISTRSDNTTTLRLKVARVFGVEEFADFSLRSQGATILNAFVNFRQLQQALNMQGRANLLLSAGMLKETASPIRENIGDHLSKLRLGLTPLFHEVFTTYQVQPEESAQVAKILEQGLWQKARLADYELDLIYRLDIGVLDLNSERIFLDSPIVRSALTVGTNARPILTYIVSLFQAGTNTTPYSMVTAAGAPWTPADMRDDEILVSQWLADDLQVKPGDEIALSYFLPESGAKLTEATNTFRVRDVVPMEMPWADRTLMPDFPGIEKAESTSDWDAGFPLTYKIRQKDEDYWKKYRGTPKAFITLAAGQKMWGNRFGNLTAIRFPIPTNAPLPLTPALSPGERENHSPTSANTETDNSLTISEQSKAQQRLSPLPGGEGQGEGERKPRTSEPPQIAAYKQALEKKILANLKPEELGLRFEPVREQALKAAEESQDFGGLFLGFSFFVIAAALLLMALLFSLGLEQRAPEIGTLLALGFTPKQVRKLLLREGVMLSLLGGILGTLGGLAYAKAMLHGLTTIWRDAVGASALNFHFTGQTLVIGLFASVIVSAITIWLTLRKFVRRPARELLVGEIGVNEFKVQSLKSKVIGAGAFTVALGLVGWSVARGDTSNAGIFFGAGALVLMAGLAMVNARLVRLSGLNDATLTPALSPGERENLAHAPIKTETDDSSRISKGAKISQRLFPLPGGEGQGEGGRGSSLSLSSLGLRGCVRRRKRSLSTVAMLACGSFLIVSIGVFRLDANRDAWKKTSGTGGFALIGETTMPVVHDLNTQAGRDFFALNEKDLAGVHFIPFRVREGDEASCLNLNRAQKPRLLGVKPELLAGRFGFAKGLDWKSLGGYARESVAEAMSSNKQPRSDERSHEIPAIGDANSIQWAMHKKVGDSIDYVDERGQPFKVRIVGAVANSILQGQLIIDEAEFVKRFPGESGYRMFLIDVPSNAVSQVSATLSRALQDVGLELTPAAERLAQFNAVQNTYLGTFQVLGGLGLLLGSVGLGIVVLRNVLERRGELAVMLAVGFRKATLQRVLLIENGALLVAGLALGVAAAAVAVLPALLSPGAQLPLGSLALTLGAVLVNGALWTWAATRLAVRGDLLKALRNE